MALPANLSYTLITGRFIRAVLDGSADPDRIPDSIPVAGLSVTITPNLSPPRVKNVSSNPPVTILIDTFTCTTDAEGDLISPDGKKGVYVISSDAKGLDPSGWTYNVRISSNFFADITVDFIAPSDGEIDLTTLVPVPASGGSYLEEWASSVIATQAALREVEAIRDVLTGVSANVAYLDEYSKIKEANIPARLEEPSLRDLIQNVADTEGFNVISIDGGGAGSFVNFNIDGGSPTDTVFEEIVDAGQPDTEIPDEVIDGGTHNGQ